MHVSVDADRFLSVACEPGELIVFDRRDRKYHLLRGSAAALWDEVGAGGSFDLEKPAEGEEDPIQALVEARLLQLEPAAVTNPGMNRRAWMYRSGRVAVGAVALPLVASIAAPRLVLGGEVPEGPSLVVPGGNGCVETLDEDGTPTLSCSPTLEEED